jgi:cation diffusion facilitator family transporter
LSGAGENRESLLMGLKISALGAVINILLAAVKVAGGIYWHSHALVADGLHSLSDLATDAVVALGLYYGSLPYDANHPYGHKKIETLAEMLTGMVLVGVALWIVISAVMELAASNQTLRPGALTMVIAAVSVVVKEWLYRITRNLGRKMGSGALVANAWHHRSDALTSVFALVAIGVARLHPSLIVLDPIASIVVSIVVGKVGVDIARSAIHGIIDTAPDPGVVKRIEDLSRAVPEVHEVHKVRARFLGSQIIADLHIKVDPHISVHEGHRIATEVENVICDDLGNIYDITVHVEPVKQKAAAQAAPGRPADI